MKKIIIYFSLFILFSPCLVKAQDNFFEDKIFKAKVIEVIEEKEEIIESGIVNKQQNLKILGLEKEFKNKEFLFVGIGNFSVVKNNLYKKGDKVLAAVSYDDQGEASYYITDYVRTNSLWFLFLIFLLTLFVVGKLKGLRSFLALIITFLIIVKYIIPQIITGKDPLIITFLGSLAILFVIVYLTEGVRKKSHIAVLCIFLSLSITIFLSWFFVGVAKLSGLTGEESFFLMEIGKQVINFKGLLLAGIIIGTLGVLDDVIISQIASVEQLIEANSFQTKKEIFKKAYKIGVSHISSMANTLFLAYAGASLPLLVLFVSGESAFSGWSQIINNETMATEIIRTLSGSIGLILAVPISTAIAVWYLKSERNN